MADDEYNRKLESLQQYIPFLNNMIVQLRDPRKKNREQQLTKMISLHSMITDKKKKLKLETLIKCEDVILKLYDKVKAGSQQPHMLAPRPVPPAPPAPNITGFPPTESPFSPITPSSPSPPRDMPRTKPVVIPTEKVIDRSDSHLSQSGGGFKAKIDIYSSAADSLKIKSFDLKANVFEQLGKKAPDMSKPPISLEDLEALQDDSNGVDTERMSLHELTDLREKLQKQLYKSEDNNDTSHNTTINTTVRNTTILTKKAVEKTVTAPEIKQKTPESKSATAKIMPLSSTTNTKPVKVIKEAASIFGNALSSIDNKLMEGVSSKLKDKERRSSTGQKKEGTEGVAEKHKERRSSKDEKKTETSSHKSSKDKTEKKPPSEHHKSKDKKEEDKKVSKEKKDEKKSKDDAKKHHDKSKTDKDNSKEKCKDASKTKEDKDKPDDKDKSKSEPMKTTETGTTFKRLADKYNPKPRKHVDNTTSAEVPKKVSEIIENSMKTSPASIPFLDTTPSPQRNSMIPQTPLNIPLLSPTSSTNSMDNEVAHYNKKPMPNQQPLISTAPQQLAMPPQTRPGLLSTPQPQHLIPHLGQNPIIPSHVSNILSNPNVTTIINNVVNQFKGGQNPLILPQNNYMPSPQQNFGNNYPSNRDFNNQSGIMPQGGNNYWNGHNQPPQNHMQNYSQRSYTPIPSQYENQMQPIDYIPQGSSTPNPYGHQPLHSPQFDGYDGRHPPQRQDRPVDDALFGNKDRDMRYRESEWRRPAPPNQWPPRDQNRDPRDPRIHRDPRAYREDPRNFRREPREYERDGRPKFRDPRLNRFAPTNRYERERTPSRTRSVSRDNDETPNTFTSPLDSLYSNSDNYRTGGGKGYGMQHFKIPKIRRESDLESERDFKKEMEVERDSKPEAETEPKATSEAEVATIESKPSVESQAAEPEPTEPTASEAKPETNDTVEEVKETDESVASASVSSSTECDAKKSNKAESETSKEPDVGEISSTNDIQTSDSKINDQTEIINKFLKKLLENERTRAAASLFIDNVKNSLDDEKLKTVVETVKSVALEEEPEEKPKILKKKKLRVVTKKKPLFKRKVNLRKRRRIVKPVEDEDDETEDVDEEGGDEEEEDTEKTKVKEGKKVKAKNDKQEVVVSVGERTKNRKRIVPASTTKRKKAKHKTELDLLHEDIQDMFIRDGVLTATGKRMCRLLKNDAETTNTSSTTKSPQPEQRTRRTRAVAEKFDLKNNTDKIKDLRVLIPKIPVDKLTEVDEDGQRYSLRRSNKAGKSYVEADSDEDKPKHKEEKVVEEKETEEPKKKEEEKIEKPEEAVEEEKDKSVMTQKKFRKRSKAWASGIIPKRKRKEVANEEEKTKTDEAERSLELVEPDKNYFSAKTMHFKTVCKLCDFNGKNITQHYRQKHPDSEVLSSRLSPNRAEKAIKESIELKLDESEDEKLASTRKYAFRCRFCDLDLNCRSSNFYDHISTHTGEFRHICLLCSFGACNVKPLKVHYMRVHGEDKGSKVGWVKTKVYGYICLECNFVQMNRKTVESHVNIYHLGEGKKIMKIYLSSLDRMIKGLAHQKESPTTEQKEVSETEDNEGTKDEPIIKTPQMRKKKKIVETTDQPEEKKLDDESEPVAKKMKTNEELQVPAEENKTEKKAGKQEHAPVRVKKEKEIDMTVFTCNTNIQEENEKIEQERLKMMTELNKSVKTNRQSLNFIEELSNRLMQEEKEEKEQKEIAAPEMVLVKSEPMEMELEPETEPVQEPEPVVFPEVTPKKPSKLMDPPTSSSMVQVLQKDNIKIQGMIQKLKGILKEEKVNAIDGPPPLAPLPEKSKEFPKGGLNAGFLTVVKSPDGLEYACRVPSCLFVSKDRDRFVSHWNEDHTRINQSYKMTICKVCHWEVSSYVDKPLLMNFFAHVEEEHLVGFHEENVTAPRSILRTRRLSGDKLSTTKEQKETEEEATTTTISTTTTTTTTTTITTTTTTTPEEIPETTEEKSKEEFDVKADENPFPFKISGVMSLADADPVPPLTPIKEKQTSPKIESVVLKEAKCNPNEKAVAWKCAEALKKFLQCPRELYKCPQFFCKFATNWRNLFDSHIKAHAAVNDELVCCVYCDVKTPLSHSGLHIDLRHSSCLYSCSQCLYRALRRQFVMVHMKLKHKESDLIISLPPKTAKTIMMSKQKRFSVKDACPPYICGHKGCSKEFLFQNEFGFHLEKVHQTIMWCGYTYKGAKCPYKCCLKSETMIDHWKIHNCFNFHCLVCKFGCMELYTMLEHYSLNHPNIEPLVVDRRKNPSTSSFNGYNEDSFSKIKYVNDELLDSVNVQQYKIVRAENQQTTTEPKPAEQQPKSVTLLPISILQGGVTTFDKKFIAIIPKSVDGGSNVVQTTKLFTALTTKESVPQPTTTQPSFIFASLPSLPSAEEEEEVVKEKDAEEAQKEDEVPMDDERNDAATNDPLSLDGDGGSMAVASGDESDSQDVTENPVMKSFGLIGYQLYRCAFCDISFSNARDFKAHCMHSKQCREPTNTVKTFKCVHCSRFFKNPHGLLEHIQYHGQLRFCCSLCIKKFPSPFSLKLHMRSKHNVTNTITTPLVPNKNNIERDEFVLRPVPVVEPDNGMESTSSQSSPGFKTIFSPDEVDQLPQRYIFTSDLKCSLCPYSTKVRTNLVRHLQFHSSEKSVPEIAPVNPVPCLDKNEKMFDKMTNLAMSSFTGGRMGGPKQEPKEKEQVQLPAYVPSNRRYVCCAEGCNYLCLQEANLRHHLYALHVQEPSFTCAHCKANLKTEIEGFLKHLKLHDLHLYKCAHCPFVHNLRHKVDKHCTDKHPEKMQRVITVRALEAEIADGMDQSQNGIAAAPTATTSAITDTPAPSNIKWTKPWHCGMCKYRCAAKSDIVTHIFNKHDINTQYKCTLCSYKTNEKQTFDEHFKENHPDNDIDIIHVYYKSENGGQTTTTQKQFDTTPLWQRDRPRVRHIRGILFEDSLPQKETKKKTIGGGRGSSTSSTSTTCSFSNLDLAIEAVAKGIDEATRALEEPLEDPLENFQMAVDPPMEDTSMQTHTQPNEESVIVIEDDEEEGGDTTQDYQSEESGLMIDVDGNAAADDPAMIKMELEEQLLSEEVLLMRYGKLCPPQGKTYKCPICFKFRTKKISYFIYHLLVELKCHRFKCKSCEYSCVTFDTMVSHCQEEHNCVITANVIDTPVDKTIEYWMQLVIRYQSRVMMQNCPPAVGEDTMMPFIKTQCEYCNRWFKNIHVLKEHEMYHWAEQTYICGHCCSEQVTLNEMFQHSFLAHPKFELSIDTKGPYVSKVIATLRSPPSTTGPQPTSSSVEEVLYGCVLCQETEKSVELLLKHHNECHKNDSDDFQYKVLTKSKVEVMYCCTYCHEKGSDELLKKHHQERHVGLKFSIYQYICLECSGTFLNIKDLRAHYNKAHPGKKVTYSCVENKSSASKDVYSCTKCPFRSCTVGGIRSHVRKHLRPVDCLLCGATFIYPTEARAHHNKEHLHNAEAVEENKERAKEYEEIVQQIIASKEKGGGGGVGGRPSPPRRMLARKSTGAPFIREYSFYGAKKDQVDLKTINTSIE